MSRDDMVVIKRTEDGIFKGYVLSCNDRTSLDNKIPDFEVDTIEEAIMEAQKIPSEYGYKFTNINEFKPKIRKIKIEAELHLSEEIWDVDEIIKGHDFNNLEFDSSEYRQFKVTEIT